MATIRRVRAGGHCRQVSPSRLDPFISAGLNEPVFLAQPLDNGRIFVVEQPGRIRVVRDGVLQTTPFLDITGRVRSGGERGLLSVAFHPQYATNRFFYVYYTTRASGSPGRPATS